MDRPLRGTSGARIRSGLENRLFMLKGGCCKPGPRRGPEVLAAGLKSRLPRADVSPNPVNRATLNYNSMIGTLSPNEQSQLMQTIEMFEIITQSQPLDYQSLEILKEAYSKLGRDEDVVRTSRRIAKAFLDLGQLSSAILEYESILQRHPEDPEVLKALAKIEIHSNNFADLEQLGMAPEPDARSAPAAPPPTEATPLREPEKPLLNIDDGRPTMFSLFVESKVVTNGDFDLCWPPPPPAKPGKVVDPFIQVLAERGTVPIEHSLKLLLEKSRLGYVPMDKYDVDIELIRSFPADLCRRWCVLPFDRMSKSILVATANPYNRQAAKEMEDAARCRLIWYVSPPPEIIRGVKKAFR